MQSIFRLFFAIQFLLIGIMAAHAEVFVDMLLDQATCKTFTVGESGHSDRCSGPYGYGLIIHDRRSRIDIEILYPGDDRGATVHRLVDFLGDGQRYFREPTIRWLITGEGESAKVAALAMGFDVEPQPYELSIPLTLVMRVEKGERECVFATLGESSKRSLDTVMKQYKEARCRPAFPK